MSAPQQPVFEAPWHAQAFALAVHLNERGAFDWPDWVEVFSGVLREEGLAKELDGGDDYFLAWVVALERICTKRGLAEAEMLGTLKADWARAYRNTPHGAPVRIEAGQGARSAVS